MQATASPYQQRHAAVFDRIQLGWFAAGAAVAFAIPFIFSSVLDLRSDFYYGVYFAAVLAFLAAYVRSTSFDLRRFFTTNWKWSLVIGVLAAIAVSTAVLQREDSTDRPDGLYFAFTIGWRGVAYGLVDALLLSAFPAAVAWSLLGQRIQTASGKALFAGGALALTLIITAAYHLGYEQYREDGVSAPETGNTIISVPTLLTANPLGSLIAHASMHVTADIHAYETETYLPPPTDAD
jgi:hypothetical protein